MISITEISVVGDINVDLIPSSLRKDLEVKKDGQHFIEDLEKRRGGQGANFSVKASELGRNVKFYGKTGKDQKAEFLESHLKEKGVKPELSKSDKIKTGTTIVLPWEDGERHYISHTENNSCLRYDDLSLETIESEHLARRGVWFSKPMLNEGNEKLLKKAKNQGVETSIDLHWDPYWERNESRADERRKNFLQALGYADILMGNKEEFMNLFKTQNIDKALEKAQKHQVISVVHAGPEGSYIQRENGKNMHIPTEKVENPSNPTGTGDVYDAAFLDAKLAGKDLKEAGEIATQSALDHLTQ